MQFLLHVSSAVITFFAFTDCRNNELSYKNMFFCEPELSDYCLWLLLLRDASLLSHRDKHELYLGSCLHAQLSLSAGDADGAF